MAEARVESAYLGLAAESMKRGVAGSSASGEFPKFTTYRSLGSTAHHVIVKFSGSDLSPGIRR